MRGVVPVPVEATLRQVLEHYNRQPGPIALLPNINLMLGGGKYPKKDRKTLAKRTVSILFASPLTLDLKTPTVDVEESLGEDSPRSGEDSEYTYHYSEEEEEEVGWSDEEDDESEDGEEGEEECLRCMDALSPTDILVCAACAGRRGRRR